MGKYAERAKELHRKGYSCAQATTAAFAEITDLDEDTLLRVSSSFGGGIGKMREVCGAVSGMLMVVGLLYGHSDVDDDRKNNVDYPRVCELADKFKEINGSIICRELLQLEGADSTKSKGRTCEEMLGDAADILEEYISQHPIENK